ncbi:MAG: ferritin-like domain-containing protein [Hymenobacteraceae bacterium]|nr:ferritin-like domain-containing protein [Hymenobacteraceae bacterium]
MSNKLRTLEDLFQEQLKDLHSAETQLLDALPKMAAKAKDAMLKKAFEAHLLETKQQVTRLDKIGSQMGLDLGGHTCHAMKGLIREGDEMMHEDAEPEAMDAGLIACAQRVEHYEISGYGTAHHFAERLGHREAAGMLAETLAEEQGADTKLNNLAKGYINAKAM